MNFWYRARRGEFPAHAARIKPKLRDPRAKGRIPRARSAYETSEYAT